MYRKFLCACVIVLPVATAGAGPIDDLVLRENPCRNLAVGNGPLRAGLALTRKVALDKFTLTATGDTLSASLRGDLVCATDPGALLPGTLAFRVQADAGIAAASCRTTATVTLSRFSGTFASLGESLRRPFETILANEIVKVAERECRTLLGAKR